MWIEHLSVQNVRNLQSQSHSFTPGTHLVTGVNGSGKTNLLEALYALITGQSFRTHHLRELIQHGKTFAQIEAQLVCRSVHYLLQMRISATGKQVWLNRRPYRSLVGLFPCSCWVPEDIGLVRAGPAYRRRFMDHYLTQVDPLYAHHLGRYQRALDQRGAWLRQGLYKGIEAFEAQMAHSASYIVQTRQECLKLQQLEFSRRLIELGFEGEHALHYEGPVDPSEAYYGRLWSGLREQEMKMGQTLRGPHLDDMSILFQGEDARKFASEGQARACVAALKIAEWQGLSQREGNALLLIDELGMGLDSYRLEKIWSWIKGWQQVFASTPQIAASINCPKKRWSMIDGLLCSESTQESFRA